MTWLPIATAPENEWVDLYVEGEGCGERTSKFRITNCWLCNGVWTSPSIISIDQRIKSKPLYWMKQPEPPE